MKRRISKKEKIRAALKWNYRRTVVFAIVLVFGLVGLSLACWRIARNPVTSAHLLQQGPSTPKLSKEYVYAGGRLIAIEEPNNGGGPSTLSAPSSLVATGTSSAQINLDWLASTGGSVDHYQVERCQNFAPNCYAVVADNVPPNSPTINYTDTVSAGSAYLYRVRAVDSSGNFTSYSGVDLATATTFTDNPLVSGVTTVKAQHLTELRQTINAVRALANLSAATWTDASPQGVPIKAVHVQEMRTALGQALTALGLSAPSYTDATLSPAISIKRVHFEELRQRVK